MHIIFCAIAQKMMYIHKSLSGDEGAKRPMSSVLLNVLFVS
jgi:hypothetical protein